MTRVLTKFFALRDVNNIAKKHDKNIMEVPALLLSQDVDILAEFVRAGNPGMDIDEAYRRLDDYLQADEDRTIYTAATQLLAELDMNVKCCRYSVTHKQGSSEQTTWITGESIKKSCDSMINDMMGSAYGQILEAAASKPLENDSQSGSIDEAEGDTPNSDIEITRDTSV